MPILRIAHRGPVVDGGKTARDDDPVGRKQPGVRRYQIVRAIDAPNHVMIDRACDTTSEAAAQLAAMRVVWGRVAAAIMSPPGARLVWTVQSTAY
jgi:hypothetical protein